MELFSTASMLAIAGKLVTVEVTKAAIAGVKSQLQPDEMALVLKQAIESAQATQPETGGIFFRCQSKAAEGFLAQLFQSIEVLQELKKPLQANGKPDVDLLVAAFDRSAQQYVGMQDYIPDTLHSWIETFVDSYFDRLQGICFQVAKAQYLKQLAHRVDDVKFVGIAVPGEEVEKQEVLAQIFVMPDVREAKRWSNNISGKNAASEFESFYEEFKSFPVNDNLKERYKEFVDSNKQKNLIDEQKGWAMRDRSAPRIPAQKVINLAQKKAVVLGAPGSGKTMLASYFALMLCGTNQSDRTQIGLEKDDDYLPVVVRIRDWILQPNMGLLDYLRSNAEANLACKELPTGFFEHWLDRGKALILLDGLDEVVDEAQRRKVAEQIETFLHQYQDNPAVITSRPAGYRWDFFNLDEFPHYTLESFDDKQVGTFIDHWYNSRLKDDKAQADRRKADLQKAFARNERIRLLAKNPLLLTIITLIHRYQAELPRQRCKLYEKAVETLLTSWDSSKEIKLYSQVLLFLKSDDLLYILKKLAYWIHTQGSTGETEGGTLIDKDELIRLLRKEIQTLKKCEAHEAKGEAERFINFIQQRTGLLNEQGRDRYAFVHKTFQEYLTAEEIFDRADVEDDTEIILDHFRQHLHDQHWREVLLLLVSKLKGKKAQKAIQAVLEADSDYEQWLHRDLLFAGWCLTEDPPELSVVAQEWVGEILDRLIGLLERTGDFLEFKKSDLIGHKIKREASKLIHCLGETTVEQDVLKKLQSQEDIPFLQLLEFQASLGQAAKTIDTLLSSLGDRSLGLGSSAIELLVKLGCNSPKMINVLFSFLNNQEESNTCASAARALGNLGSSNPEVANRLLSLLRDRKESNVIHDAVSALGQISDSNPKILNILFSLLCNKTNEIHKEIINSALVPLGKKNNLEVLNMLIILLKDEYWYIRLYAAKGLGYSGNTNPAIMNGLISLMNDKDDIVRLNAAKALSQLGNTTPLLSFVCNRDEGSHVRSLAAEDLNNSSPKIIDSLLFLLDDEDSRVRCRSASALVRLGDRSPEVLSELIRLLDDKKDWSVQTSAIEALGHFPETVNRLLSLLGDPNHMVSSHAAFTLGYLGDSSSAVVSGLLKYADDQGWGLSGVSIALVRLSRISDAVLPGVVQWLERNPNNYRISSAIDCLWSIVVE